MKRLIIFLLCLFPLFATYANEEIKLPEVARYGRGIINDIAWHPDGEIIAVASGTGVWLYDIDFNTLGQVTTGNAMNVTWSGDGTYLAQVDTQHCRVWQNVLTNPEMVFEPDNCYRQSMTWYDNTFFYQKSQDYSVYAVDLSNDHQETIFPFDTILQGLYPSPDGSNLLGITATTLNLWDVSTGNLIQNLEIYNDVNENNYKNFSPSAIWDNNTIYVLCSEGDYGSTFSYACEWDITTNELIKHDQLLYSTYWFPQNITITSPHEIIYISTFQQPHTNVFIWNRLTYEESILPDLTYRQDISVYDLNADQTKLLVGTHDGRLILYDTHANEIVTQAQPHLFPVHDLAWHPNDGRLAVLGFGMQYETQIWQLENDNLYDTGIRIPFFIPENVDWYETENGSELVMSGNSYGDTANTYAYGSFDGENYENIEYGEGQSSLNPTYEELIPRTSSNNSAREAINDYQARQIRVEPDFEYQYQEGQRISEMIWSPDDSWFVSVIAEEGNSLTILIWNTTTWEQVYQHTFQQDSYYRQFEWSHDSRYFAYSNSDIVNVELESTIYIVAVTRANQIEVLQYDSSVQNLVWSPDSRFLMVDSEQLDFYDVPSLIPVATIDDDASVYDWRDDGAYLAGGNSNGTVTIWDMRELMSQ